MANKDKKEDKYMPNEEKESQDKKVESQPTTSEKKISTHPAHGTKTVILVVVLVLVAIGLGAAAKFAVFAHRGKNIRTGRIRMMQNVGPRMMGRARAEGFNESGISVSGTITAINGDKLTVKTADKDQTVNISDTTSIIKGGQIAAKGNLKENDNVIAAGTSNSAGDLVATRIIVK